MASAGLWEMLPLVLAPRACYPTHHIILTGHLQVALIFTVLKPACPFLLLFQVFGLVCFVCESWFSTAQADLLPPSPKDWSCRFAPPDPASFVMILEGVLVTESHI